MRSRFALPALGTALLAAPSLLAQSVPCTSATTCTYRSDPTPNSWVSIAPSAGGLGTPVVFSSVDDGTATITFPACFTFTYYCGTAPKTSVFMCTNGFLNFGTTTTLLSNRHPNDDALPNDAIFPWWDDLHLGPASSLGSGYFWFDCTPGAERAIFEWNNVINYPSTVVQAPFSFQAILYASTHGSRPDTIEFRYDRRSRPGLPACATTLTCTPSATVGCEPATAVGTPSFGGLDATERGASNNVFPACDLRLTRVIVNQVQHAAVLNLLPAVPFCSIVPIPGSVQVPNTCTAGQICTDNDNSAATQGAEIALPWKFNYDGRIYAHANMNSNGFLGISQGSFGTNNTNGALPAPATEPDAMLAPFWDDLEGSSPLSGMWYRVDGAPGCRVMTFEWARMDRKIGTTGDCIGNGGSVSFQIKFYEGSAGGIFASIAPCPYDTVVPGIGNDRIEFHYDHAAFVPPGTAFTATIGWENHSGSTGGTLPGSPSLAFFPVLTSGAPALVSLDACDTGKVRYYGDRNSSLPPPIAGSCAPEIKFSGVSPVIGNTFTLEMIGGQSGALGFLFLDFAAIPGTKAPVACGGLSLPQLGTFWVNPFTALVLPCGPLLGAPGTCEGCCGIDLPIPLNPALCGFSFWAEWVAFYSVTFPPFFALEHTEGAKITIGC